MASSLLLVQQSVNEELEELEDAYEAEVSADEGPPSSERPGVELTGLATGRDLLIQRRRNVYPLLPNSVALNRTSVGNSPAGQRTSVLLNAHIYGLDTLALSSRTRITSVTDKRQAIQQSNVLLQTWTDQMDPLVEEISEETQPVDDAKSPSRERETAILSSASRPPILQGPSQELETVTKREAPTIPLLSVEETTDLFRKKIEDTLQDTMHGPMGDEEVGRPNLLKLTLDLGYSNIARLPENVVGLAKTELERLALSQNQIWHIPLRFAECS